MQAARSYRFSLSRFKSRLPAPAIKSTDSITFAAALTSSPSAIKKKIHAAKRDETGMKPAQPRLTGTPRPEHQQNDKQKQNRHKIHKTEKRA